jgi:hypothetical protein
MQSKTTDINEEAIDIAAWAIWQDYPSPLPAWNEIPELSLNGISKGDFRRMARAAVRGYRAAMEDMQNV